MTNFALANSAAALPNIPPWLAIRFPNMPAWLVYLFQYKSFIALFIAAAAVTALATPLYILLAHRLGWVDRPGGRKQHAHTTATMGGIVVFLAVFAGVGIAMSLSNRVGDMLRPHTVSIYTLLVCTACMIGLGVVDDRQGVSPRVKLLVQAVVAFAAVCLGYRVEAITLPGLESLPLPAAAGGLLSLLWIVGITNAMNLADGLDGLAAGIAFFAAAVNGVVGVWLENYYMAVLMFLLAGALLGFLKWNFHPARVFLGDTGSMGLGVFLAMASLHSAQKAHTVVLILVPLFALGYPIFDTLLAVARRTLRGQPLFASDRGHIHHRLVERGVSHSTAAVYIYIASILLCVACLSAVAANHLALGLAITGVLLMAIFCVRFLGYLEWGGWMTRWRGRADMRLLHAAAALSRLKIEQARDLASLTTALAVFAREIGCIGLHVRYRDQSINWSGDIQAAEVAVRPAQSADGDDATLDLPLGDSASLRLTFSTGEPLSGDQGILLDQLRHAASERLRILNRGADD